MAKAQAQTQPQAAPVQQSLKARQSSVSEWDHESGAFDADKMWKVWEEDLESSLKPASAVQTASALQPSHVEQTGPAVSPARITNSVSATALPTMPSAPAAVEEIENTSRGPQPWAVDLAQTESRMERMGEVEYSNSFKKQELLKIQTAEFMSVLRQEFGRHIEIFNESRRSGAHAVHLYRITNTEQDYMLFRNGVKLVVSGQRSGRILFAFNQFLGQIYATQQNPHFELEAQWGPFDQLLWTYKNERVQVQDVVRFFLTEFVRQSYK
jgi:hypothetical protein